MALYTDSYPFRQKPLPYSYNQLESIIDEENLTLHYTRILPEAFERLNDALEGYPQLQSMTMEELLMDYMFLPFEIRDVIAINAGSIYNHSVFFEGLTPGGNEPSDSTLIQEINFSFGSLERLKELMILAASGLYGSGYVALVSTHRRGLRIITVENEDTAIRINLLPIVQIDLWEHAYYTQYYERKGDYAKQALELVNWDIAQERYDMNFEFRRKIQ